MRRIQTIVIAAIAALALHMCTPAYADGWLTEFGGGYKLPDTTSVVLLPECHQATPFTIEGERVRDRATASCGGDNPVFVGWPIAYEWDECFIPSMTCRLGWFHMSHWGDGRGKIAQLLGGDGRETHMDCLCITFTKRWGKKR